MRPDIAGAPVEERVAACTAARNFGARPANPAGTVPERNPPIR